MSLVVFLDASKAFDRVNHAVLFKLLMDRNLPCTVLRFLFSWYKDYLSDSFGVTNGVRQGVSNSIFRLY